MKKVKITVILAFCMVIVMSFAACGSKPYDFDLSEYIKVGEYNGLEVKSYTVSVTDEEVATEIQSRLEAKAETKEVKSGTVAAGDTVIITYDGKIDGKAFDGGSAQGSSLTIGSGTLIPGFEDGLIGVEVGKAKTLNLKFPDDYKQQSDLAGKDVEFTVTVDAKQERSVPTLDEKFVEANSTYKTVEEYKTSVKEELTTKKEKSAIKTQKEYLWNQIVKTSEVVKDDEGKEKYPQEEIDRVKEETKTLYQNYAEQYEMEFADFLEQQMSMNEETFNTQVDEYAKLVVKEEEVLYAIAKKEKIEVSSKEYKQYIKDSLEEYGYTEETFKEANGESYEKAMGKDNIRRQVYMEKVLDLVLKNAKVVDQLTTETP
ncbi:MAG: trigger factor, partial [Anaerovoracaceae bacterium]